MPEGCDPLGYLAFQQQILKENTSRISNYHYVQRLRRDNNNNTSDGDAKVAPGPVAPVADASGRPPLFPATMLCYSNPITHEEYTYGDLRHNAVLRTGKRTTYKGARGRAEESTPSSSRPGSSSSSHTQNSRRSQSSRRSVSPRSAELMKRIDVLERTLLEERDGRTQVQAELSALQNLLEQYISKNSKSNAPSTGNEGGENNNTRASPQVDERPPTAPKR